jgi:hypothetical protein
MDQPAGGWAFAVAFEEPPVEEPKKWRYLLIEGWGTSTDNTTRMVEVEAFDENDKDVIEMRDDSDTVAKIIDYENTTGGSWANSSGIPRIADRDTRHLSGTYPIWNWTPLPNGLVVIDIGYETELKRLKYYGHSSTTQRANRFKIKASNTNNGSDWVTLWDMSENNELQEKLPDGFYETLL